MYAMTTRVAFTPSAFIPNSAYLRATAAPVSSNLKCALCLRSHTLRPASTFSPRSYFKLRPSLRVPPHAPRRELACAPACKYGDDEGKAKLLSYCENQGVERDVASRVLDLAERSVREWSMTVSDFLTPPESVALETALNTRDSLLVVPWGGYEEAERRVFFLAHSDAILTSDALRELAQTQIRVLRIRAQGSSDAGLGHRDFLGALVGAGVSRAKVGDIVVQPGGSEAHVLVHEDMATVVQASLVSVASTQVSVDVCDSAELKLPPRRVKEVQTVESSMRLDAVASAGLKLSRSKLADMTRSGLVFLNYKETRSPAKNLKQGDVVSVRGVGKMQVDECSTTSKGRFRILIKRYI